MMNAQNAGRKTLNETNIKRYISNQPRNREGRSSRNIKRRKRTSSNKRKEQSENTNNNNPVSFPFSPPHPYIYSSLQYALPYPLRKPSNHLEFPPFPRAYLGVPKQNRENDNQAKQVKIIETKREME